MTYKPDDSSTEGRKSPPVLRSVVEMPDGRVISFGEHRSRAQLEEFTGKVLQALDLLIAEIKDLKQMIKDRDERDMQIRIAAENRIRVIAIDES